jgi:hypothetical protein
MFKRLLIVLVLGALLVGTLGISAGTMIADRAMAEDQTQTDDGGIIKHMMTKAFESGFRMFMNAIPPDELVDIAMEARPDVMEMAAARFETKSYAATVTMLIKNNPMFIYDIVSEMDSESLYKSINILLEKNPAIISDAMSKLDTRALADFINTVSKKNPAFMSDIAMQVDTEPFVKPMVTIFEENPDILIDVIEEVDEDTLNTVMDKAFGKMRSVDVGTEIPEQMVQGTLVLPPEMARLVGQDKIKVKMIAGTDKINARITSAEIHKESKK